MKQSAPLARLLRLFRAADSNNRLRLTDGPAASVLDNAAQLILIQRRLYACVVVVMSEKLNRRVIRSVRSVLPQGTYESVIAPFSDGRVWVNRSLVADFVLWELIHPRRCGRKRLVPQDLIRCAALVKTAGEP